MKSLILPIFGALALAGGATAIATPGRVLVVVSAAREIPLENGRTYATGHFLGEVAEPLQALQKNGYAFDFASPGGVAPVIDQNSLRLIYWLRPDQLFRRKSSLRFLDSLEGFKHPLRLEEVAASGGGDYEAIFIPGGHAPMADLADNADLAKLLLRFHEQGRPIALICHAPVALLSLKNEQPWPFAGYRLTVISTREEKSAEKWFLHGRTAYYPEEELRALGAAVDEGWSNFSHTVWDRELVTGQNPFSPTAFSKLFLKALRKYEADGRLN